MDTSRVDGVKAPRHRGTPRSHGQRLPVRQAPDLEHELQTRVVQRQQIRDALRAATQALGLVVEVDLDAAPARDLGQGVLRRVICEGDTFDERNWDADSSYLVKNLDAALQLLGAVRGDKALFGERVPEAREDLLYTLVVLVVQPIPGMVLRNVVIPVWKSTDEFGRSGGLHKPSSTRRADGVLWSRRPPNR